MALWGLFGTAVAFFLYALISTIDSTSSLTAKLFLVLWPFPFSMSVGGMGLLYIGEILPATGVSIAVLVVYLIGFVHVQVFLPLADAIDLTGVFFMMAGFNLFSVIILYFEMVESKGKSKGIIILEYASKTHPKFKAELAMSLAGPEIAKIKKNSVEMTASTNC